METQLDSAVLSGVVPSEIQIFLETCLVEKGIIDVPEDLRHRMIGDLAVRLEQWLVTDMIARLPQSDQQEFDRFLETQPTQPEIAVFLQQKIPNFQALYSDAMRAFKEAYVGN